MNHSKRFLLLALFTGLTASGLLAQAAGTGGTTSAPTGGNTTTSGTTTPPTPSGPRDKGPAENASDTAKAVQKVIADFQVQRDRYLAERKTLLEKLRTATETDRKTILDQLRTENEKRADEERALGKQIREELKKLREERKSAGS